MCPRKKKKQQASKQLRYKKQPGFTNSLVFWSWIYNSPISKLLCSLPQDRSLVLVWCLLCKECIRKVHAKNTLSTKSVHHDYPRLSFSRDSLAAPPACSAFILIPAGHPCVSIRATNRKKYCTGLSTYLEEVQHVQDTKFSLNSLCFRISSHESFPDKPPFLFQVYKRSLSMSKIHTTALNTQGIAPFTRSEMTNVVRKVTVNRMAEPAAGTVTHRSTIPFLPSSLQSLLKVHDSLDSLPSLHAKLLSQLPGLYCRIPQNLQILRRDMTKLTKKFVYLSLWIDSADISLHDIGMSLDLLNHCSTRLFQKVVARLKEPFRPATDRKMEI